MSSANETGAAATAAGTSEGELPVVELIDLEATITDQEGVLLPLLDEAIATSAVQDMVRLAFGDEDPETLDGSINPVTIGEALENAAVNIGDKPVTASDASAIQSAEARATGVPTGVKGGPGAAALSAVDSAAASECYLTIEDILGDASSLLCTKEMNVTPGDAAKVQAAEARNNDGRVEKGGVASAMQQAAAHNENTGALGSA